MPPKGSKQTTEQNEDGTLFDLVRVISGFRITLPERVRDDYGIKEGEHLALQRSREGWVISKPTISTIDVNGRTRDLQVAASG